MLVLWSVSLDSLLWVLCIHSLVSACWSPNYSYLPPSSETIPWTIGFNLFTSNLSRTCWDTYVTPQLTYPLPWTAHKAITGKEIQKLPLPMSQGKQLWEAIYTSELSVGLGWGWDITKTHTLDFFNLCLACPTPLLVSLRNTSFINSFFMNYYLSLCSGETDQR